MPRKPTITRNGSIFGAAKVNPAHDIIQASKNSDMLLLQHYLPRRGTNISNNSIDRNHLSSLHYAARNDDVERIEAIISHSSSDVNIKGLDNMTPLHLAATSNKVAALRTLQMYNADSCAQNSEGNIPLHCAAKAGSLDGCRELLSKQPFTIDCINRNEATPLHMACIGGHASVCLELINRGADIMAKTADGSLPIHIVAKQGNVEIMELLLSAYTAKYSRREDYIMECNYDGASVLHRAVQGRQEMKRGFTPLHYAAISNHSSLMQLLIQTKPAIDARDDDHRTPLHQAAIFSFIDIMEILIKAGASIDASDKEQNTPLLLAAYRNKIEAVQYLIDLHCNIHANDIKGRNCLHLAIAGSNDELELLNYLLSIYKVPYLESTDNYGKTPLHYACQDGKYKIVNLLLKYEINVYLVDQDGNNCFHLACKNSYPDIAELLLNHSAGLLNSENADNCNGLHISVIKGCPSTVRLLLQHGAEIDRRNASYSTPLDTARMNGSHQIVQLLIDHGAALNTLNRSGESALHIAARHGKADIVKLLLNCGADCTIENNRQKNSLEIAIQHDQQGVAIEIATKPKNRDLLLKVGKENITTMQSIIQKMPKVASEVMNTCIKKSSTFDREGKNIYTIEYDFTLLEPGEELEEMYNLPKGIHNLNALTTIVSSNHVGLLEHPLSARLLDTKWSHFGRRVYVFNLMIYILFIVALTAYVLNIEDYFNSAYSKVHLIGLQPSNAFSGNAKPASRSISAFSNSTSNGTVIDDIARNHSSIPILKALILVFSIVNLIREIFQLYHEKWKYFLSYENYFEIALHTSVIAFAVGPGTSSYFWAIGTFSVQLAYIELVMFLRKLPVVGKYVLMIRSMVNTILKVMIIVFIFVMGFAISFGMQCLHEVAFSNIFLSVIKVIDMMVGEIDYKDVFLSGIQNGDIAYPGSYAVLVILIIFIFIMSILVMNLMIGLAVGDIAEMEKKAKLRRLADLTDYFYNIDKIMSRHLRKQYKIDKITCTEVERITTVDKSNSNECLFESHNSEISSQMQEMVRQFESQRMRLIAMEEKLRFICQNMDDTSTS